MPISHDRLPYRPCVGIMALNSAGMVWVGHRVGSPNQQSGKPGGWWQMPQGGIDEGEEPAAAALRELTEETGIRSARILGESREWHNYDLPSQLLGRTWGGRYRGQTQKWYALRFTGNDREINIATPGGGAHKPEFTAWRWEPMERLPDLVVPFKRPVYERVVAEFGRFTKR